MDDSKFHEIVDKEFFLIEDRLDELELDIDINASGGVLTLSFSHVSSIVLSRHVTSHEIWIAAKSGGFHLGLVGDIWYCDSTGESLKEVLNRVFMEQLNEVLF